MGEGEPRQHPVTDPDWPDHCGDRWRAHVLRETGFDICSVLGASPRRARDWVALMRRVNARCMSDVVSVIHGKSIPIRQARRGDIVRVGWAIGICRGDIAEFYGGQMAPMRDVHEAWMVSPDQGD